MIFLNVLIKPVWIFMIDRQVQNTVGHEAYGVYFALLNLSFVVSFLADAGITNMLNQRLASKEALNVKRLLGLKLLLLLIYSLACCGIAWLTGITQWPPLLLIVAVQALTSLFLFLRNIVTAHQFFTTDAWLSVIDKLLMILFCGAVIYGAGVFGPINIYRFLYIQAGCTAVAVTVALTVILRKRFLTGDVSEDAVSLFRRTAPFAIIVLLMSVHYRLDGFLLERMRADGPYQAGVYAMAYRLLDAGNMIGYLAASFLVPFIARNQLNRPLLQNTITTARHGLLFAAIGAVCFTAAFADWIQEVLYHSGTSYVSTVLQYGIAALPGYYLVHLYGSALTATSRRSTFIYILIITVLINMVLNVLLIPRYGALGCCFAALASQYFCGVACAMAATRSMQLPPDFRSLLLYMALTVALAGLFYTGKALLLNVWLILALAVAIAAVILALRFNQVKKYFISTR